MRDVPLAAGPAGNPCSPLELWVGPECTINRIGDEWRDQSELTGFTRRPGDIDRLASLGATRIRLPVLWERVATRGGALDFGWADEALARSRAAGLQPIVGLLHHGSGPGHTSLVDPRFPALFADYARRVAERYPEIDAWTPINEPLTTARFACLYGLWYPHAADDRSFVRALLNQVQATVLAMRAIRAVNPAAQLVQTDDLGFTRATPALAHQAAFDNERRWLAFDLLCGRVDTQHALWPWLRARGASACELARLVEAPCVPGIVGINAYVTSERFLDERLDLHPPHLHGGNGVQAYADVEAVRVHGGLIDGFAGRLREAHARYGLPLAITEVHLGCTREEQMRWLAQAWRAALQARAEGVDVRALTAWAAFGTVDWDSLLTQQRGHYEPGLWDVRSEPPRITALGRLAAALAGGVVDDATLHPVLAGPGWWQRDLRLCIPAVGAVTALPLQGASLLILGSGALARALARLCHLRGLPHELLATVGSGGAAEAASLLEAHAPWAVIDASGNDEVDAAEGDARHWRRHALAPAVLARACARAQVRLLMFSSHLVFPGRVGPHYLEREAVGPLNAYGRALAHAERAVLACAPATLVVRTAGVFGPWDEDNFIGRGMALLQQGRPWPAAHDQVLSPTYLPDLVQAALDLLVDGEAGLWHLTNGKALSWAQFAVRAAEHARHDTGLVTPASSLELGHVAMRPAFSALGSERGLLLPSLDDALSRYQSDREPPPVLAMA